MGSELIFNPHNQPDQPLLGWFFCDCGVKSNYVIAVVVILLIKAGSGSNYSKTQHWTDFDPGIDTKKVGNPKYPHAAMDSVLKNKMHDDLTLL